MQYLVHTSGQVANRYDKAYVVKASSADEAGEMAKKNFNEDFYVIDENIDVKPYVRTRKAIVAYVFLLIPILLSFINWKEGHDTISLCPTYVSCLYAIVLYSAFIIRVKGIQKTVGSWIDIVFCIMNILLFSSFIKVMLAEKFIMLFGVIKVPIDTNMILLAVILLSWVGLKLLSVVCMGIVIILSVSNLSLLGDAMGSIYGPMYIICAFVGLLLYLNIEPVFFDILSNIGKTAKKGFDYMRKDFAIAGNEVKSHKNTIEKIRKQI